MARRRARRRSYNPFRMWGAWVGVAAGAVWGLVDGCFSGSCDTVPYLSSLLPNAQIIGSALVFVGGGFLIGWGIHSAFRRWW